MLAQSRVFEGGGGKEVIAKVFVSFLLFLFRNAVLIRRKAWL